MGIFDKETQLKVRMVNDKSAYKADLEYKAEATFRTERCSGLIWNIFTGFLSKQVEDLSLQKNL